MEHVSPPFLLLHCHSDYFAPHACCFSNSFSSAANLFLSCAASVLYPSISNEWRCLRRQKRFFANFIISSSFASDQSKCFQSVREYNGGNISGVRMRNQRYREESPIHDSAKRHKARKLIQCMLTRLFVVTSLVDLVHLFHQVAILFP